PFDQVTRALLTASGDAAAASPASFFFAVGNSPERVAEAVGRGLLGVRLGCAQCHDHPLAEWKREDFWGLAAFFAGTGTSPRQVRRQRLRRPLAGRGHLSEQGVPAGQRAGRREWYVPAAGADAVARAGVRRPRPVAESQKRPSAQPAVHVRRADAPGTARRGP